MPDPSEARIRRAEPDDAAAIRAVASAAFGAEDPSHGADIVALIDDLERRGLWLAQEVAEVLGTDGAPQVAGHVGLSRAWLDSRTALVDVWLLSPLSVHPRHQRGGLGAALVAAAIEAAGAADAPLLFLEGSPHFYERCGFERASARGFEPPSRRIPDAAFQVVRLPAHEEWMTGRVIYPDVWWEHDSVGLRDPDLASLEEVLGRS